MGISGRRAYESQNLETGLPADNSPLPLWKSSAILKNMQTERIEYALSIVSDTKSFIIGHDILKDFPAFFSEYFKGKPAFVITDSVIFNAFGKKLLKDFRASGLSIEEPFIFNGDPVLHAEYDLVLELVSAMEKVSAVPVAVGSGTINDLVKLASHMLSKPYAVIPSAASVDGYTAYGAAIVKEGFKQTIQCRAPEVIYADMMSSKCPCSNDCSWIR